MGTKHFIFTAMCFMAAVTALFSTATAFAEVRIVALGDSQMHGYHLPDGQSYPAQLEAASRGRQPQG